MGRLFAGTAWDRPPTCDRLWRARGAIAHVRLRVVEGKLIPPESQTARLRVEKRAKGKHVTTVAGLDPDGKRPCWPRSAPQGYVWNWRHSSRTASSSSKAITWVAPESALGAIGIQNAGLMMVVVVLGPKGGGGGQAVQGRSGDSSWGYQLAELAADPSLGCAGCGGFYPKTGSLPAEFR